MLLILLTLSITVTKKVKKTKFQAISGHKRNFSNGKNGKQRSYNRYLTKKALRSLHFFKIFNLLICLGIKKIIQPIKTKQKG